MQQEHTDTVGSILDWFQEAVPTPTDKNLHVQLGVHFEEVAEMLEPLQAEDTKTLALRLDAQAALSRLADHLKTSKTTAVMIEPWGEIDVLDALCDQIVTALGVGHMLGFDMKNALAEVDASNWSKFHGGRAVFNENGKIAKGPDYFKPDLLRFTLLTPADPAG